MKRIILIFILLIKILYSYQVVNYLQDSIVQKDDKYIKLLGGSSWELNIPSLALPTDDVIIVFYQHNKSIIPIYYYEDEEILAHYIEGSLIANTGYVTTVMQVFKEGAILKTMDGYFLYIPQYYRYYTNFWLPPYKILIDSSQQFFWNLNKIKKIQLNGISK